MIRKTEQVCQKAWEETSLWESVARKVMGEPLVDVLDQFGVYLEAMRGNGHLEYKKKMLQESRVLLLQARRYLIRAAKRGVMGAREGHELLEAVEGLRYDLETMNEANKGLYRAA